jgi:uncharacterized protein
MGNNKSSVTPILMTGLLALSILFSGFFIGKGLYSSHGNQPYITVKGLAERFVKADLGVWAVTCTSVGDDITTINTELLRQQNLVLNFLKNKGFNDKEISFDQIKLVDRYANQYQADKPIQRYLIKGVVRVRSSNVELVKQASQSTGELLKQGITLSDDTEDGTTNPAFYFTQLNSIRPSMLSEATTSAFNVASQFARDTRSKLGTIRRANQGVFEITSPDAPGIADNNYAWQLRQQGSIYKKIRLVSTIDYFLG